jgi:hypothetical protein
MPEEFENITRAVSVDRYTVQQCAATGKVRVLRDGLAWRDCTGDKLVLALAMEVEHVRTVLTEIKDQHPLLADDDTKAIIGKAIEHGFTPSNRR